MGIGMGAVAAIGGGRGGGLVTKRELTPDELLRTVQDLLVIKNWPLWQWFLSIGLLIGGIVSAATEGSTAEIVVFFVLFVAVFLVSWVEIVTL